MKVLVILTAFLMCHFLADFCLTNRSMLMAKADGRSLWPILWHAAIHGVLIAVCVWVAVDFRTAVWAFIIECFTHCAIDWGKGRIMGQYPVYADTHEKRYWMLFGFDQLLHLYVLLFICSFIL